MIRTKRMIYVTVFILSSSQYLLCKEGVSYKFQRNACDKFNKKFVSSFSCHVKHYNRSTQIMNVEINLQPNVSLNNLLIDFITHYKFRTVYRPSVIKFSEHLCESLDKSKGAVSHFLNAFGESYAKYSNVLDPCPKSGKIYFRNMILDTTNFPPFMPVGEYRVDARLSTYINGTEEFVFLYQDYIEVSYKYQRTACNNFNKAFVYNITCRVKHLNRTTQILNWEANLQPNLIINKIRTQINSHYKFGTAFRPILINYSHFICSDINNGSYDYHLNGDRDEFVKHSNLLDTCPKSGHLYVKDLLFKPIKFPEFVPIGEYRLDLKYFTYMNGKEEFMFMNQDYFEVKPLGIEQF